MKAHPGDILVLDIETVSCTKEMAALPAEMQAHWKRKARFIRNDEELSEAELYFDRGAIYAEFGKVIVIAVGIFHQLEDKTWGLRVTSFEDDNEKALLERFGSFLDGKFDPEKLRLCAHNGKEFDYPYLCRRMLVNGLTIPRTLMLSDKKPWEILHLDTLEMWKFGDRKNFTSLDLLTALFGISSSKSDIDGSRVNMVYYEGENGLTRIAEYCRGDVVATAQLYLKLNNLPLIPESNIKIVS